MMQQLCARAGEADDDDNGAVFDPGSQRLQRCTLGRIYQRQGDMMA